MDNTLYKEHILDHYKNPRNKKILQNYTHSSDVANRSCGDEVTMQLLVEDGKIVDVGYDVRACAICTASVSMLTEKVLGMQIEDVASIKDSEILQLVGMREGSGRSKCALLGIRALKQATGV